MLTIKMSSALVADISQPLNKWDKRSIRPGPVGSVGDVLTSVRIKQSMPDMDFAYDKKFSPQTDILRGSNVQDGQWFSFSNHGNGPQVKRRKLNLKADVGWVKQDIVPLDRATEPVLLDQPQHGWKSQAAEILQRQGDMFQTLPGGYGPPPNTILRGNAFPVPQNNVSELPQTSAVLNSVVTKSEPAFANTIAKAPSPRNKFGLTIDTSPTSPVSIKME